jgi:hypothetical protein
MCSGSCTRSCLRMYRGVRHTNSQACAALPLLCSRYASCRSDSVQDNDRHDRAGWRGGLESLRANERAYVRRSTVGDGIRSAHSPGPLIPTRHMYQL